MSTRNPEKPRVYMGDRGFWKVTLAPKPRGAALAWDHYRPWNKTHDFVRDLNVRIVERRMSLGVPT